MTDAHEISHFFKLSSALGAARRAGDNKAMWEAADDLEIMAMHSDNPALRARASAAVGAQWDPVPAPSV